MIQAIVFDLDNCIAPSDELGAGLFAPAFEAMRAANDGTVSETALQAAFADCWRHPLDWVARHHGLPDAIYAAGFRAFQSLEVDRPMHGYGDLDALAALPVNRFLVTSGFRRLQASKLRALSIEHLFTSIEIDALDEGMGSGKEPVLRDLSRRYALVPHQTLVVGDNPDSELAAGRRLGMPTVQTLRPRVPHSDAADRHVRDFHELAQMIRAGDRGS